MDMPLTLKIVVVATCAALFLGTLRVRPWVVGCLAMLVPPAFFFADFNGPAPLTADIRGQLLPWVIFLSIFAAVPAMLIGSAAAFVGEWLTRNRSQAQSTPED